MVQLTQIIYPDQWAFLADATSLFLECWQRPNATAATAHMIPPPQNALPTAAGDEPYTSSGASTGQNSFDCYRHGVYPRIINSYSGDGYSFTGPCFAPTGGKVAYNILYFDGHVAQCSDRSTSYQSVRMRYPN